MRLIGNDRDRPVGVDLTNAFARRVSDHAAARD